MIQTIRLQHNQFHYKKQLQNIQQQLEVETGVHKSVKNQENKLNNKLDINAKKDEERQ